MTSRATGFALCLLPGCLWANEAAIRKALAPKLGGATIEAVVPAPVAYCPACKRFEAELQRVDDVTIYVFMYPVIRPDLAEHSQAVWCSTDRGAAWLDLVLRGKRPAARAACQDPVEEICSSGGRCESTPRRR